MHIEYLKYFHEVACMKSISKAANNAHISQPALSQQIQRLEEMLGHTLLIRSNKGVELTEPGRIVEKYAKNLIRSYENMLEDLHAIEGNQSTIRIEASSALATYALPCTLYSLQQQFPDYVFNLTSNITDDVEQNVSNDVCDVGFIYGKPEDRNLSYTKVGKDRLVIVAGEGYSIQEDMSFKDLVLYDLIMLNDNLRAKKLLDQYLNNLGFHSEDFKVALSLDSIESVKSAVIKGYGVSILPYIALKKELYTNQLKVITIPEFRLEYDIYLVYKNQNDTNENVRNFIRHVKKIGDKSFC